MFSDQSDAVAEARRWLTQRGITVPDDAAEVGHPTSAPRAPAQRAPELAPSRPASGTVGRDDGPDADPESVARTVVLRKLSAQARTRHELQQALKAKEVPEEAATSVLDRMEALGLVDDSTFARDWIESRQQRRYLSKAALRRELSAKGIDREEIESALEVVDGDEELAAARALAEKKVRSMGELAPQVRYRRLAGVLARRGFSSAIVGRVVDEALRASD